jgi:hypothetical protein
MKEMRMLERYLEVELWHGWGLQDNHPIDNASNLVMMNAMKKLD